MAGREEEVDFRSGRDKVFGTLRIADGPGETPIVILAHGFGSFRDELTGFVDLADRLADAGISSLRLDMRGCGKNGRRGVMHPMWDWVEDVRSAVSFAETLDGVAGDKVGVVGMSMGGGVAVIAAALDERIKAVVALAPVADGLAWFRHLWTSSRGAAAWENFLERIASARRESTRKDWPIIDVLDAMAYQPGDRAAFLDMLKTYPAFLDRFSLSAVDSAFCVRATPLAASIAPRPLLVVHSRADMSVPVSHGEAIHRAAGEPRRLVLIDDSPHCFWIHEASDRVQQETVAWLSKYL